MINCMILLKIMEYFLLEISSFVHYHSGMEQNYGKSIQSV